jgi:hypothetical protein
VLILPLLVVLVVAALAAAGVAATSGYGRAERSLLGGAGPPLVLLVGVVAVVVLGAAAVSMVGLRGGGGDDDQPAAADPPGTSPAVPKGQPAPPPTEPAGTQPQQPLEEPAAGHPSEVRTEAVTLTAAGPELAITSGAPAAVVDRLPERAVLLVTARGFKPGTGQVAQCGLDPEGPRACVNRFPVEFDAGGTARFQYLVSDRVRSTGQCGAGQAPCLVVVFGSHGESRGSAFTVFHDPAPPPGRVTVAPRAGLSDGDQVTIRASGFPPATRLIATQCPAGTGVDTSRCRRAASSRTGPEGDAVLRLTVSTDAVDGVGCGPRQPCSVRVVAEAAVAPVTIPVAFTAGPSARYHGGRVATGLALAALLLALAWWLVRTTDWREPAAASTPEMDQAVLDA